jgi:hypothetical protein
VWCWDVDNVNEHDRREIGDREMAACQTHHGALAK